MSNLSTFSSSEIKRDKKTEKLSLLKVIKNLSIISAKKINNKIKKTGDYINKRPVLKKMLIISGTILIYFIITGYINPKVAQAVEPVFKKSKTTGPERAVKNRKKLAKKGGTKILKNGVQVIKPENMEGFVNSVYSVKRLQIRRAELWAKVAAGTILSPIANALVLTALAGGTLYLGYEGYKAFIKSR